MGKSGKARRVIVVVARYVESSCADQARHVSCRDALHDGLVVRAFTGLLGNQFAPAAQHGQAT
jgi:hypothetical protein